MAGVYGVSGDEHAHLTIIENDKRFIHELQGFIESTASMCDQEQKLALCLMLLDYGLNGPSIEEQLPRLIESCSRAVSIGSILRIHAHVHTRAADMWDSDDMKRIATILMFHEHNYVEHM